MRTYSTWGSDLSFNYGAFLGVSVAGEVVVLDSTGKVTWIPSVS